MVLTVSFVLSPVIGLVCHRRWQVIANLTPASRRQDHTTSPSAAAPFVCVSQAEDPIAPMLPRPPHPLPNVCDDRETPLCVGRDGGRCRFDLGLRRSGIFFAEGLDSKSVICPSGKSASLPGERKAAACEYSYVEEKRHGFQLWASRLRTILQPVPTTSNVIELHR